MADFFESCDWWDGLSRHLVHDHSACRVLARATGGARDWCLLIEVDTPVVLYVGGDIPRVPNRLLKLAENDFNRLLQHQNELILHCDACKVLDSNHVEIFGLDALQIQWTQR